MKNRQPGVRTLPRSKRNASRHNVIWRGEKRRHDGLSRLKQHIALIPHIPRFSPENIKGLLEALKTNAEETINA